MSDYTDADGLRWRLHDITSTSNFEISSITGEGEAWAEVAIAGGGGGGIPAGRFAPNCACGD